MSPSLPPAIDIDEGSDRRVFRIGPYRLAQKLGAGAMGTVYRAEHAETGAVVAIKTSRNTRQSAVASVRREIEILEQLDHPGVVRLLDEGTSRGIPWFAMELLEGTSLFHLLAQMTDPFDSQLELGAPGTQSYSGGDAGEGFDGPNLRSTRPEQPPPELAAPDRAAPDRAAPDRAAPDRAEPGPNPPRQTEHQSAFDIESARPGLSILSRLCHTLSYLHNEGVIHRDLKPSNVFLREGGEPVLVDFGVVGWFEGSEGRERLMGIDRRRFAGTLKYMAPEQIRGDLVDARADLYAVGCILYAFVVGHHPFGARTPQEVIQRHMDGDYIRPTDLVDELPRELVALIDKLLSPDPARRIGHADVVAKALERLVGQDQLAQDQLGRDQPGRGQPGKDRRSPKAPEDDLAPEGPSPTLRSTHLNKPRFVGRDELFESIQRALLEAARRHSGNTSKPPTVLIVGGHSGSGKTRLAMELGAAVENVGFRVTTECAESGLAEPKQRAHAEPLGVFRSTLQAIADHCRERGAEETTRVVGRRADVLAQYEPSLVGLPGRSGRPRPVELPSRAARVRTFTYLTETLAAFAESRPILIIIDDLHLADELSLGFLDSMLRTGGVEQVAILATYNLEERDEMDELLVYDQVSHFELDALEGEDVGSLVGGMLAMDDPPRDFVTRLSALSMGNPFAVSEYVHAAVEQGLLVRSEHGAWRVDPVLLEIGEPGELLAPSRRLASVIEGRLERLEPVERRLVDVATVSTRRLEPELLGELAGLSNDESGSAIERLCHRRIFEKKAGRVRVVEQVRRVAYRRLSKKERRRLHRRLARILERQSGDNPDVLHLLEQWRGSGVRSRELCYVEPAAENALVRGAPSAARALLQRGLRLVAHLEDEQIEKGQPKRGALARRRAKLERLLAKVHWSSGEVGRTIALLDRSLRHLGFALPETTSQWYADAALQGARQLRNLVWPPTESPGDTKDAQRLEQGLESGLALLWPLILRGNIDEAVVLAATLANMSDRLGARQHYALPFALLAGFCHQIGLAPLANFYEARARANLAQSQSVADFIGATRIFMYWSAAHGRWEQVESLLGAALDYSEEVGDQPGHESLLITGALFELSRDRLDKARQLLRSTDGVEQLVGSAMSGSEMRGAWTRVVHAMIARQEGDSQRALEYIDGQVQRFTQMSERTGLGHALTISAVTHCEVGLVSQGFRLGEEAFELFEKLRGGSDRNVVLYCLYEGLPSAFLCCWRSDKLDDAKRARALGYVRYLTERLEKLAATVPAARAAWLRNRGVLTAIDGDTAAASALLSKSIAAARRFGLPYQDRLTRQIAASLGELQSR